MIVVHREDSDAKTSDLRAPGPDERIWVDMFDPSSKELDQLASVFDLDALTMESLHTGQSRTKLVRSMNTLRVAFHDCKINDELLTGEIDVVLGDHWLISVRYSESDLDFPIEEVTRRARLRDRVLEPIHVLWAFVDLLVDRYLDVCDVVDDRLDDVADLVFDDDAEGGMPRELFELRRALADFRRRIGPLREVLGEILRSDRAMERDDLLAIQDVHDRQLRVLDLVETQRDLLGGLLEAELAVASNRMNRVMKTMTSWGAILLVATLIAGIYGMNFRNMPELGWRLGYPLALLSMVVFTVGLYTYFKRKDYL